MSFTSYFEIFRVTFPAFTPKINMLKFFLSGIVLTFIVSIPAHSQLLSDSYPQSIHRFSEIVDLEFESISFEKLLELEPTLEFQKLKDENTNLGFTENHYWIRFVLENQEENPKVIYLETGRPITDVVDLYQVLPNGKVAKFINGDLIPNSKRAFNHRKIIFPITLEPNSSYKFYINYQSDGEVINLPLKIHDANFLIQEAYFDQLIFGIFYGILLLAGVTYLFFYFGIRQKSFLLYVLYVFSVALLHFSLDGYFHQYLTPEITWFSKRAVLLFAAFSAFAFGRYVQIYVELKAFSPILNKLFNINLILMVGLIAMVFIWQSGLPYYYPAVNAIALLLIILSIASIVGSYINNRPVDLFFTLGIFSLTLGFIIFILNNFSLIPNSFLTENITKLSTGLEIVFLSLSMSNRIRLLKSEKEKIQEMALIQSEESNQIKSFFLSNISHELRTPLNAIIGLSKSIHEEIKDTKTKNNLEVIQYSSLGLLSAIDDILDYSKIEKNELKLEMKPFNLPKLIQQLVSTNENQAVDKNLKFIFEETQQIPEIVIGDLNRTRQILQNLLNNAIKFTQEGEIKFLINSQMLSDSRSKIQFDIIDTGIGIKKEKLDRIFESFIQEQLDDKRKFGGFGLGLCIVKALVDQYDGKLEIDSNQGKGTNVKVILVLDVVKQDSLVNLNDEKSDASILSDRKILVVEDNPVNQMVMKSILKKWDGISFDLALNGLEALDKLSSGNFDLILMDLQMPEMDGYEATIAIREGKTGQENTKIPIIAVTADATDKARNKVYEVGMDDYLTKPVDKDLLLEKVKNQLSRHKINFDA